MSAERQHLPFFDKHPPVTVYQKTSRNDNLYRGERQGYDRAGLPINDSYTQSLSNGYYDYVQFLIRRTTPDAVLANSRSDALLEYAALKTEEGRGVSHHFLAANEFARRHSHWQEMIPDPRSIGDDKIYIRRVDDYARSAAKEQGRYRAQSTGPWELTFKLNPTIEATELFCTTYASEYPVLSGVVEARLAELEAIRANGLDMQAYIDGQTTRALDSLEQSLSRDRWINNLVKTTQNLDTVPVTLDSSSAEVDIQGLSHLKFGRFAQDLLDVRLDEKPLIITGENGMGKTHIMESVGLALTTASSTARAAVASMVMPELDGLAILYRPEGGQDGYSSFGLEAKQLGELLDWAEGLHGSSKLRVALFDEPISTTSPEDASYILTKVHSRLRELGVMVITTSHADVSGMVENDEARAVHIVKEGRKPRELAEGIGDSQFISLAETMGMNPEIIARAQQILDGAEVDLGQVLTNPDDTRASVVERYGDVNPGLGWLLPRRPSDIRSSSKWRANETLEQEAQSWEDRQKWQEIRESLLLAHNTDQRNYIFGNKGFASNGVFYRHDIYSEILEDGSTNNVQDIASRREFFINMMRFEGREELLHKLSEFGTIFHVLSADYTRGFGEAESNSTYNLDPTIFPGKGISRAIYTINSVERGTDLNIIKNVRLRTIETLIQLGEGRFSSELYDALKEYDLLVRSLIEFIDRFDQVVDYENPQTLPFGWEPQTRIAKLCNTIHGFSGKEEYDAGLNYEQYQAKRDLDHIFYEVTFGVLGHSFGSRKTELTLRETERLLDMLIPTDSYYEGIYHAMLEAAKVSMSDLDIDDLTAKDHQAFKGYMNDLDKVFVDSIGSKVGYRGRNTLQTLAYITSERDLVEEIAADLSAIGGEVAESLAGYYRSNVAAYFAGAHGGREYAQLVKARLEDIFREHTRDEIKEKHWAHRAKDELEMPLPKTTIMKERGYSSDAEEIVTPWSDGKLLHSAVNLASHFADRGYTANVPSTNLEIRNFRLPYNWERDAHDKTSLRYENPGGIDVITGSNMSGKTTFGQSLFIQIAEANAFGLTSAVAAGIPKYNNAVYIDRPAQDAGKGLSSGAADIDNWMKALDVLDGAPPSFVFIDEPFSSTSAKYQRAMMLAAIERLATQGHRVVVATHNHQAVDTLQAAKDSGTAAMDIEFHHLTSVVSEDSVEFTHQYAEGHAESSAVQVARMLGGDSLRRIL